MIEKTPPKKEHGEISSETNSSPTNSRRNFLTKVALAAPVITTIAAKPVWAGQSSCTVSGMISGNLSHQGSDVECDGYGFSPGGWWSALKGKGHPYEWPAPLSGSLTLLDLNSNTMKDALGHTTDIVPRSGDDDTFRDFIKGGKNQYVRRFVQGLLNTRAYDLNWYQGPLSEHPTIFPFLFGWPYTIEGLVLAYNAGNLTIFEDIADKEF